MNGIAISLSVKELITLPNTNTIDTGHILPVDNFVITQSALTVDMPSHLGEYFSSVVTGEVYPNRQVIPEENAAIISCSSHWTLVWTHNSHNIDKEHTVVFDNFILITTVSSRTTGTYSCYKQGDHGDMQLMGSSVLESSGKPIALFCRVVYCKVI